MKPLSDNARAIRNHIEEAWKLAEAGEQATAVSGEIVGRGRHEAYMATRAALEEALAQIEKVRR